MSDSEDGQRNSSVGGDFSVGGHTGAATTEADEEEDEHGGDSLDIKPPQARISRSRDNSLTGGGRHHHHHNHHQHHHKDLQAGPAMRDKKHSKEKRHSKEAAMHHHSDSDGLAAAPHHHHQHRSDRGDRSEHRERDRKGRSSASDRHSSGNEHHRRDTGDMLALYHYRGVPPMRYSGGAVEEERYRSKVSYENSYSGSQQRKGYFEVYSRDESSSYVSKGGSDYGHHRSHHHHSAAGHDGHSESRHSERHKYSAYMEEYMPPRYDMPPKGGKETGKMAHELHSRKYKMWKNVEDLEQDLRSRLVNKCKNFVADEHADYEMPAATAEYGRGHKVSRHAADKEQREREHNSHQARSSERSKNRPKVIEVLDSPEAGSAATAEDSGKEELQRRRKHKQQHKPEPAESQPVAAPAASAQAPEEPAAQREKRKTPDDPELLARRAKIIAAYREKTKRREELEARRDMRRQDALSPSAIAASVTAGLKVVKRKSKSGVVEEAADDEDGGAVKRKRRRVKKSKRSDGELDDDDEDEEMPVASGRKEAAEEEDSESDSDSDSKAEQDSDASSDEEGALSDGRAGRRLKKAKAKKQHAAAAELYSDGDLRLADSPLSVSELSKSPAPKKKRKHHSKKSAVGGGGAKHKHKHHHHHRRSGGKHGEAAVEGGETAKHEVAGTVHSVSEDESHKSESRSRSPSHTSRSRSRSPLSVSEEEEEDEEEESGSSSGSRSGSAATRSSHSRSQSRSPSRSQSDGSERSTASRFRRHSRSRSRSGTRSEERGMDGGGGKEEAAAATTTTKVTSFSEDLLKTTATGGRSSPASRDGSPVCDDKGKPLPNYFPGIQGCRSVEEFQCLNRIEEGTYGVVYRAKDKRTNEIVALKRLKMEKEKEGFPITSLREINTLLKGQHPNIVTVREIVVGSNMDKIFIVMDYVEHDLKSLMETMKHRKQVFFPGEVKCLIQQLLRAVSHLHDNWILHRDLKTSNLLLSHKGILKVGDFGLAREYGSPLKRYTSLVVTLWYRAPELLLCSPEYSTGIDIWSVGCIFAEFLQMAPMFPGKTEIDQLNRIFKELGTPNEKVWPGYNELPAVKNLISQNSHFADYPVSNLRKHFGDRTTSTGVSLLLGLLTYDPKQRLTADSALKHDYFKELPLPIDPSMFPTWPAKSELGARKALASSPKPPSGGSQFKQLGRDDVLVGGGGPGGHKIVSGIITGNKKTASNTGFVLNAGIDQRHHLVAKGGGSGGASGGGFKLKF